MKGIEDKEDGGMKRMRRIKGMKKVEGME